MQSQKPIAWIARSKDPEASHTTADDKGNTSNEISRIPRLAYSSLSKAGAWREGVKSRNDHNIFETQNGFYKAEMPAQLQPDSARDGDENAEQSYFFEGAEDVNTRTESPMGASSLGRMSTDDKPSGGTSHTSSISSYPSPSSSSSSQPRSPPHRLRNPRFSDSGSNTLNHTSPSSPTLSAAALDALLDASIERTRTLLAAGREALRSTAGADFKEQWKCGIGDADDNRTAPRNIKRDPKEAPSHPLPHLPSYNNPINLTAPLATQIDWKAAAEKEKEAREDERKDQRAFAQSIETAVSNGIVGMQNWYRIKGAGEAWKEIGGGGPEDLGGLLGDMGLERDVDGDVDVDESEGEDCMF